MNRTIAGSGHLGNGNKEGSVATSAMDLQDAIYHTARSYDGGARALSRRMQTRDKVSGELVPMNENTFTHKVNPNCHTHHVTAEEARDMMVLSGDFRILYSMCADTGHVAVKVAPEAGSGLTFERISAMAKEFGELVAAATDAQSHAGEGGASISPNEMSRIEREGVELMGAINSLLCGMRSQMVEAR